MFVYVWWESVGLRCVVLGRVPRPFGREKERMGKRRKSEWRENLQQQLVLSEASIQI